MPGSAGGQYDWPPQHPVAPPPRGPQMNCSLRREVFFLAASTSTNRAVLNSLGLKYLCKLTPYLLCDGNYVLSFNNVVIHKQISHTFIRFSYSTCAGGLMAKNVGRRVWESSLCDWMSKPVKINRKATFKPRWLNIMNETSSNLESGN